MSCYSEFATRPSPKHLHCEQEPDALTRLQDAVDSGELERVDSSFVARGASMAAREIARVSSNSIIGANVHYDTAESSSGLRRLAGEVGKKLMSRLFPDRYPPHVLYVMHSLIDNVYLPKPGEIKNHGAPTTLLRGSTVLGFDDNGTDFGMAQVERGAGVSDSTVFGPVKIGEGARVTNSVVSYVCPQPVPIVGEDAD